MTRMLIVDDEIKLAKVLAEALQSTTLQVERCPLGREGLERARRTRYDLVLTDLKMADLDGITLLRTLRAEMPETDVMVMTAYGSIDVAVEAMRLGAVDYLTKPFAIDELRMKVTRVVARRRLEGRTRELEGLLRQQNSFTEVTAVSARMRAVVELAQQVAPTTSTVLLTGPSGTGKTSLSRTIHRASQQSEQPLREVYLGATTTSAFETVIAQNTDGAGALLLDEIGELDAPMQLRLLRFLESRPSLRVLATTNRDLAAAVTAGSFRDDLFYRLNVFPIVLPSLAERAADIEPLALAIIARRGADPKRLTPEARTALGRYRWPGNIRELENVLERALIVSCGEPIATAHLPTALFTDAPLISADSLLRPGFSLDQLEKDVIYQALAKAGGNKSEAARMLGITRRRLYSRLKSMAEDEADET